MVFTACTGNSALGQDPSAIDRPFVVTAGGEPDTWGSRLGLLIYKEAFRRLGLPMRMEHYTLARGAAMVEQGLADAELSRVYEYGLDKPHLIRVEESIVDLGFSLYTANPELRIERLEDLRSIKPLVEYRRGLLLCENTLRPLVAPERLSDVTTREQGLKKMLAGRTDVYCEIDVYVKQEIHSPEFRVIDNIDKVRRLVSLGKTIPTYPYLHRKHAELAPRLAKVLRQMKAQGLMEAYQKQVERELGW